MNVNTMSLEECWDWLCNERWQVGNPGWSDKCTLDALDRARPGGWEFIVFSKFVGGKCVGWNGRGYKTLTKPQRRLKAGDIFAPTRLECEARLVVAMLMAEGEVKA